MTQLGTSAAGGRSWDTVPNQRTVAPRGESGLDGRALVHQPGQDELGLRMGYAARYSERVLCFNRRSPFGRIWTCLRLFVRDLRMVVIVALNA